MSIQDIINAGAAMAALTAKITGFVGEADAKIAAKEVQVDTFIDTAAVKLTTGAKLVFDPEVFYMKSLTNWGVDPVDDTKTNWFEIPSLVSGLIYGMSENYRATVSLSRCYGLYPGYYENPRFSNDTSFTKIDLVVAGASTPSADINQALADQDVEPTSIGTWSYGSFSYPVPILVVPGANTGGRLFARFRNHAAPVAEVNINTPPQEITAFGGDAVLGVTELNIYSK